MVSFLSKMLVLILFSFLIIFYYYAFPAHKENFDWYTVYVVIMWIIYAIYKYFKTFSWWEKVSYWLKELFSYFLLNLFILSILFFSYNNLPIGNWFTLFFKIILFLIVPFFIVLITTSFWKRIIELLKLEKKDEKIYNFVLSLWVWFSAFVSLIFIIGLVWFYNIYSFLTVSILFIIFSYKQIIELLKWFNDYEISFDNHILETDDFIKKINFYLLSSEFLFIIATLIISVNLISIVRPMPIGWDDLWVYMNFPRQMAHSWDVWFLWWMYAWQILTGIWYMIKEPVQAFFINNLWSILSFVLIILVVSDLLKTTKKRFFNIPLLIATIFISMPMIIFQQAKDMKLDSGLFFLSLIALYVTYKVFFTHLYVKKQSILEKAKWFFQVNSSYKDDVVNFYSWKKLLTIIFIIGLLSWFVFAVKFTSLLLIVAIIWVLFYLWLWTFWFLSYLFLFIAVFTKAWLWSYLNIVYDKTNINLINSVSVISIFLFLTFITVWVKRYGYDEFKIVVKKVVIYILGVVIALSPWFVKNIIQIKQSNTWISIGTLLSGHQKSFVADYSKLYTSDELTRLKLESSKSWLNNSWTTTNEDWWRYFGYQKGINNYVKLPWNLTMQVNQWWEFTTIWWLFLALIPALLLFLPYRKKFFDLFPILLLASEIFLFVLPSSRVYFTNIMSSITLPLGYIIILLLFIVPILYYIVSLKHTRLTTLFKLNLIFTVFYTFLWSVSAYWVVWYGIMMYFGMLLIIAIWLHYLISYDQKEDKTDFVIIKFFSSIIIFSIISVWFFLSVFPHAFTNLKTAWYPYYKMWNYSANELIFMYHRDYLPILLELNIAKDKRAEFIQSTFKDKKLEALAKPYLWDISKLSTFLELTEKWEFSKILPENILSQVPENVKNSLKKSAHITKLAIFDWILKPSKDFRNTTWVYRVGTFLKYFISGNYYRLYEDSLLDKFDLYFYSRNPDLTVSKIKKFWLNSLLVDLNAATIDRDPRHALTKRYIEMLKTFTSSKLKLVSTDSICLKYAREKYFYSKKTNKDMQDYINTAFVNSESYKDWKTIPRGQKLLRCYENILQSINSRQVSKDRYSYLLPISNYLLSHLELQKDKNKLVRYLQQVIKPGGKVLFEVK